MCDSVPIPADLVGDLIGKEDLEWYDERYDPESELQQPMILSCTVFLNDYAFDGGEYIKC